MPICIGNVIVCEQVWPEELDDCDYPIGAVQLSQAGPLAVWSVGFDNALVCTDVTTCRMRTSTYLPPCPLPCFGGVIYLDPHGCDI